MSSDNNGTEVPKTQEQRQQEAENDLNSLSRVSHRLAMVDTTEKLSQVLDKLLPRLLERIGENHKLQLVENWDVRSRIHNKLVEMLSHTMKRVREDRQCRIPCWGILELLVEPSFTVKSDVDPFTMNLSLAFLTLGMSRYQDCETLLPALFALHGHFSALSPTKLLQSPSTKSQWHQITHLLFRAMDSIMQKEEKNIKGLPFPNASTNKRHKSTDSHETDSKIQDPFNPTRTLLAQDEVAAGACYDLLLDLLLYQTVPVNSSVPPPGLSQAAHDRLKGGQSESARDWAAEMAPRSQLVQMKMRCLDWIAPSRRWGILMKNSIGRTRTMSLLITAAGDPTPEVSQRAATYLKQHLDAQRGEAYGDAGLLVEELLILCVGASNAQLVLSKPQCTLRTLGIYHDVLTTNQQAALTLKRRTVSEGTFAIMVDHVSKIVQEVPQLVSDNVASVASLALLACTKPLSQLRTSSGMTMLQGKQYVSAAQLLNALVVRLSTMPFDNVLPPFLAKAMEVACSCLAVVLPSNGTTTKSTSGSEGNTAVRDALYGVICVLSRSNGPQDKMTWLFEKGELIESSTISIATATLLFGCIAAEEETLRPRAVAALDALLAAYCRIINADESNQGSAEVSGETSKDTVTQVVANPWGELSVATDVIMKDNDTTRKAHQIELCKQLLPLLWNAAQHSQPKQCRVAAARWASDLLCGLDLISACHILCFLAGDSDLTAASIARDALTIGKDSQKDSKSSSSKAPADFSKLVGVLLTENNATVNNSSWRQNFWQFTPQGQAVAIEYLVKCLLHDIYGGDDDATITFVSAIATSILNATKNARREYLGLLDECAEALSLCLSTSDLARTFITSADSPLKPSTIQELCLGCNSSKARRLLAESWGQLYLDPALWVDDERHAIVEASLRSCVELIQGNTSSVGNKHGAAFLGGTCMKVYRRNSTLIASESMSTLASRILSQMANDLANSDDIVGNACSDALAIAFSYDQLDAPLLQDALIPGATNVLSKLSDAIRKYGNGDKIDVPRVSKLMKSAGICLAATTATAGHVDETATLGEARLKCVDALFLMLGSTSFRKDEEVALWAGEALADYCDSFSPKDVTWSTKEDTWPPDNNEEFALRLPPHQQVVFKLLRRAKFENNPQKRTACAPALFAVVARAAKHVNLDSNRSHRCLVQELCHRLEEVQGCFLSLLADPKCKHLSRESCCLGLAACRSLANVTSDKSEDINARLLRAFGQTTIHGGSAMQETPEQAAERRRIEGRMDEGDSPDAVMEAGEIGGASGISEASLGAYREMASAAMSLGRPDILYSLLMLSVSNPAWSSDGRQYGHSILLGHQSFLGNQRNVSDMQTALKGHPGKLIPRILRGCHSPNKETREQMQSLWVGLTGGGAEGRSAISQHLLVTVDTLMEDSSNKLWRTRLGACGALAQVIVGRSWRELGGGPAVLFDDDVFTRTTTEATSAGVRLLRLWRVAMRSLDDVRANVREAGESLGRGVKSLTLRLVDPNALREGDSIPDNILNIEEDASAAAATALRWLIKHGLKQQCPEAAGVCISCLVGIVDVANPLILQPLVPDSLRSLLLAMSTLEPAAFSYLQVRAAGQERGSDTYDSLERLRLQVVQSGPLATAVTKCLDMIPRLDPKVQQAVVPELDSAIRLSAGLTTRTAAADCVATLCSTCPNAFKNNLPSSKNPSVSLLRVLYSACERERGQAARDKYAHACGSLAALCPGSSVRSLALRASGKYNSSTGSNDDPAARKAAAITLRAIAVKASSHFSDGGNNDIWCRRVLPVAFLGMRDPDPSVASLFADVWEEGGSVANLSGAADGFGSLLEEKLILSLVQECIKALKDVSWSRRVTGANALKELATKEILSPAPRRLNSGMRERVLEDLIRAQRRAQASSLAMISLTTGITETRLWSGKQSLVESCCLIASKWSSALANTRDLIGVLGIEPDDPAATSKPSIPLQMACTDSDDLFVGDAYFREKVENELPEESIQESSEMMDVDEVKTEQGMLDFDEDAAMDEQAETIAGEIEHEETAASQMQPSVPTFLGICRMFLTQAFPTRRSTLSVQEEEVLPYRAAALKSLSNLLESIDVSLHGDEQKKDAFKFIIKSLTPLFDPDGDELTSGKEESPLIVSRAIDCFAASFWEGFGTENPGERKYRVLVLVQIFAQLSAVERPWTVKTSSLHACARLVSKIVPDLLKDHTTVATIVECASLALKDRKFWKVRLAGLEVLQALVSRCGQGNVDTNSQGTDPNVDDRQLILEAVLPQKEIISSLTKQTLRDSEAKVTALASQILSSMTWWP